MTEETPHLSSGFAIIFYGLMAALAWGLSTWVWPGDLWFWHNDNGTTLLQDAGIGVAIGLVTVFASNVLDRYATWAQTLSAEFAKLLGPLRPWDVLVLAVCSGFAEEMLFRGFLQQVLTDRAFDGSIWAGLVVTSLVFGLVHIGPSWSKFWPWTVMAIVMGGVIGGAYVYTGNLLAPVIAHFTINFLNLSTIVERNREE